MRCSCNVFLLLAAACFSSAHAEDRHLYLIEHATTDTTAHIGAKADNTGDILTFHNVLFDASDKHRLGSDNGYCVRTEIGKSYECIWTSLLGDGQITVEGPFYDDADSVLAVTGGTGAYEGAKGQMRLHARDAKGSAYDFRYELSNKR
jgi:hypothetical protein